jgi:hypothetical protein
MQRDFHSMLRRVNNLLQSSAIQPSESGLPCNTVIGEILLLDESKKFRYSDEPLDAPLDLRIKHVNTSTGITTKLNDECKGVVETLPNGLGLFSFDEKQRRGLVLAERNLIELFRTRENYAHLSPQPNGDIRKFVALFWSQHHKICSPLSEVLYELSRLSDLVDLIDSVYIPLISSILEIPTDLVLQASTEIIYYPRYSSAGLEQHIDNVRRTGGVLGPVCSINFVSSRYFDMLPSCTNDSSLMPFRIRTNPGDLLIIDSEARILWSHAVPFGGDEERYSIIIRPISDGSQYGGPIKWSEKLNVPVYPPPKALKNHDFTSDCRIAGRGRIIGPAVNQEHPAAVNDEEMAGIWLECAGIHGLEFQINQGTSSSARDIRVALERNSQLQLFFNGKTPVIWEVYGHDGADTLTFLHSFENAEISTMSSGRRFKNLKENINCFRNKCKSMNLRYGRVGNIFNGAFADQCINITSDIDMLYVDPRWRDVGSVHDELNVLELCRLMQTEVFKPCESKLDKIKAICFKVRYDWPVFQCVMLECELTGFRHVQTIDVCGGFKHHYFHLIAREHVDRMIPRITFSMENRPAMGRGGRRQGYSGPMMGRGRGYSRGGGRPNA